MQTVKLDGENVVITTETTQDVTTYLASLNDEEEYLVNQIAILQAQLDEVRNKKAVVSQTV